MKISKVGVQFIITKNPEQLKTKNTLVILETCSKHRGLLILLPSLSKKIYQVLNYIFIAFQDFIKGLSILLRGTVQEKLNWAFNLYDINKDGYITKEVRDGTPIQLSSEPVLLNFKILNNFNGYFKISFQETKKIICDVDSNETYCSKINWNLYSFVIISKKTTKCLNVICFFFFLLVIWRKVGILGSYIGLPMSSGQQFCGTGVPENQQLSKLYHPVVVLIFLFVGVDQDNGGIYKHNWR